MLKVLVVEDEPDIQSVLLKALKEFGYQAELAKDGNQALCLAQHQVYDIILLDIMLPKMDGIHVAQQLRLHKNTTPILFMTAKSDLESKLKGFELGAEDYLVKPFPLAELNARIRVATRRHPTEAKPLEYKSLKLNPEARAIFIDGQSIPLTKTEFDLLELLLKNRNKVFSRQTLFEQIRGAHYDLNTNLIDVHIKSLRNKIKKYKNNIVTVRGIGFKFIDED